MANITIDPDGQWEYLNVLNECLKIILTILLGFAIGTVGAFQAETFVPQSIKFVFYVALPLHILKGIGVGVDFYDDSFLWNYIGAFLVLRFITLVVALCWVGFKLHSGHGIGQVAVLWLSLSWISTVILGIPIAEAVFDDGTKGATYGLLAGISSFIFQLPLQLLFLECHALEQEELESVVAEFYDVETHSEEVGTEQSEGPKPTSNEEDMSIQKKKIETAETSQSATVDLKNWLQFAGRAEVWRRIGSRIVRNPVVWGIFGGFVLSLSTLGPTYLHPKRPDYVPGLGWFWGTATWLGNCVSPVSLFTMGLWMQSQGPKLFRVPLTTMFFFMLSKLVAVPLLMCGLAKMVGLNNEAGRAAVLIASLPISLASFSLAGNYNIGEAILSENVALGTALLLPTILIWNLVMDAVDLFPIS